MLEPANLLIDEIDFVSVRAGQLRRAILERKRCAFTGRESIFKRRFAVKFVNEMIVCVEDFDAERDSSSACYRAG